MLLLLLLNLLLPFIDADVEERRLLGMGLSLPQLSENVGQFLTLPLGTDVCAQAALQELEGALILGHLQQFHGALLVGSMTNHLAYQIAGEFGVAGLNLQIEIENFYKLLIVNKSLIQLTIYLRSSNGSHADP